MNCPIPLEMLVRYWACDLSDDETYAIDEHVFGCSACFEASSRVAALSRALTEVIPPVATARDIELAAQRGMRHASNDFSPGVPKEAWLHPGTDLLVHRLLGELEDVEQVSIELVLPDGRPLMRFDDVPFDLAGGAILIACQRHFVERFPPDVGIVVHRSHRDGRETADKYVVLHRIG